MDHRQELIIRNYFANNPNEIEKYLSPSFQIEANRIENLWYSTVIKHYASGNTLRLVIFAEAPLSFDKYFYNKPNKFLTGLKNHYKRSSILLHGNPINQTNLLDFLVERGVLLCDLFRYPLPSDIYKKEYNAFIDEYSITSKLNLILPLFNNDIRFIFRYKMHWYERKLYMLNPLASYKSRFILEHGLPTNLYLREYGEQTIKPCAIPFL